MRTWKFLRRNFDVIFDLLKKCPRYGWNLATALGQVAVAHMHCKNRQHMLAWPRRVGFYSKLQAGCGLQKGNHFSIISGIFANSGQGLNLMIVTNALLTIIIVGHLRTRIRKKSHNIGKFSSSILVQTLTKLNDLFTGSIRSSLNGAV